MEYQVHSPFLPTQRLGSASVEIVESDPPIKQLGDLARLAEKTDDQSEEGIACTELERGTDQRYTVT